MVPPTRRQTLRLGLGVASTGVAGCLEPVLDRPTLSITALNFVDEFHRLGLELWRTDREAASDAIVFSQEYELPASGADVVDAQDEAVAPSRRYLVRAELDGQIDAHYHFFPDCRASEELTDRLYVEVHTGTGSDPSVPELEFQQNRCGGDGFL